jgi:hypothetical protein
VKKTTCKYCAKPVTQKKQTKKRKLKRMLISNAIETNEGVVTFEGRLEGDELAKVIEVGLTVLVQMGVLKPKAAPKSPIIGA